MDGVFIGLRLGLVYICLLAGTVTNSIYGIIDHCIIIHMPTFHLSEPEHRYCIDLLLLL